MKNPHILLTFFTFLFYFIQIWGKNPDEDIVILYTNDVHCAIDETIGYAGLSYYRGEINKKTPYVSLVDAGDHVQGGTIGSLSSGRYLIDIMNAVGYDVATPGNHEFDYGLEQFQTFVKNLTCSYISCNFRDAKSGKLVLQPYRILEFGEVKVAFVGISTPETLTKAVSNTFQDENNQYLYDFDGDEQGEKLIASIQDAVNKARTEGHADFVIGLGHLGEKEDVVKEWSAPYVVERTSGIDAFIDGHSHEVTKQLLQKNLVGKEIPITQSGSRLIKIGQVTIGKDGKIKTELIDPEEVKGTDENILNLIKDIQSSYGEQLLEVIGMVGFDLNINDEEGNRIIRKRETNLANLITDAYLYESEPYGGADVALVNSGSIRVPMKAGNITYGNIIETIPFTNPACIIETSGQSILDALELGARKYQEENGSFLQTAGLTYAIDGDIPSTVVLSKINNTDMFTGVTGERRVHSVMVNGQPLDPQKRYKVVSTTYLLLEYGDGFVFEGSTIINSQYALPNELLISYIKNIGDGIKKYKEPQGRITFSKKTGETNTQPTTGTDTKQPTSILDDSNLNTSSSRRRISSNAGLSGILFIVTFIILRRKIE